MFEYLQNRIPKIIDEERYKKYAVIVPVLQVKGQDHLLFEIRSEQLKSQPGEICFPGGAIEKDELPVEAAIRELSEELLYSPEKLDVICPLDYLITPYTTMIYPFLGVLNDYQNTFSRQEVKDVFTVPVAYFLDKTPLQYQYKIDTRPQEDFPHHLVPNGKEYPWKKGKNTVLFYVYKDKIIWGLTAKIIHHFVTVIKKEKNGIHPQNFS